MDWITDQIKEKRSKFKILLSKLHWSEYCDKQNVLHAFNSGVVFLYIFLENSPKKARSLIG